MRLSKFEWNGDDIKDRMKRAQARAVIAIGENIAMEAKQIVHVVTGTLRRSIHTAPRFYDGSGDLGMATTTDLPNVGPEGVTFEGASALIEVGSWLPYAYIEEIVRGHAYIQPAAELVRPRTQEIINQAIREEGL